ncbi:MAG: hypothetical protein H6720_24765 [Sandaracinus sp.]|nr:hypothetical protein [Myxococcales bacterium]MCB9603545.1 hypothetical protein [Sandaracinus sp.]
MVSACGNGSDRSELFGDQWDVQLKERYVVGTDVAFRLTEWTRPEPGDWDLFPSRPCEGPEDTCRELEGFEVESTDPSVLRIDDEGGRPVGRALADGATELVVRFEGDVVTRRTVTVATPERLEIWPEGWDELSTTAAYSGRVRRLAGGVLDLHARFYVGEERYFGDGLATFETTLPSAVPAWSAARNVLRVEGDRIGVETVRVDAAGQSASIEVETLASVDEVTSVHVGAFFFAYPELEDEAWGTVLVGGTVDGESVAGSLPARWQVDGVEIGEAPMLGCRGEEGASTVVVRVGDVETELVLNERCAETRLLPWSTRE